MSVCALFIYSFIFIGNDDGSERLIYAVGYTNQYNTTLNTTDLWVEKSSEATKYTGRAPCKIEDIHMHFFKDHFNIKKYVMAIIPGIFLPKCQYKFNFKEATTDTKQSYFKRSVVEEGFQMCPY